MSEEDNKPELLKLYCMKLNLSQKSITEVTLAVKKLQMTLKQLMKKLQINMFLKWKNQLVIHQ
jgi:hypothetical protein